MGWEEFKRVDNFFTCKCVKTNNKLHSLCFCKAASYYVYDENHLKIQQIFKRIIKKTRK